MKDHVLAWVDVGPCHMKKSDREEPVSRLSWRTLPLLLKKDVVPFKI
jgi:hypothetical protein